MDIKEGTMAPPVYAPGANKASSNQKCCPHTQMDCNGLRTYTNFFVLMLSDAKNATKALIINFVH